MVDSQKKILSVSILTFIATFQFNVNTVNMKRAFHLNPKKNNMNVSEKKQSSCQSIKILTIPLCCLNLSFVLWEKYSFPSYIKKN